MKNRTAEKKPLSFSTTMRNPSRIVAFLSCLLPYENQLLTTGVILKIIKNVIRQKLYAPNIVKQDVTLKSIFYSEGETYSEEQIDYIIKMSPQKHKEAGFDYGWDSRFDTWYKLSMEFGYVKYAMNELIIISATGHMLIDAFNEESINEQKIQTVFLNSMMKYQSNNPYRKNSNCNIPLVLLLQVLRLLKEDPEENGAGVFRKELSLFICWENNSAIDLYKKIKEIRKDVKYTYSDEYIYDICLNLLGVLKEKSKRFKMNQICGEAVDEYIRKMRSTGIISLRGCGRFIDYNSWEIDKINYILQTYSTCKTFASKNDYFNYISSIDYTIINIASSMPVDVSALKKSSLQKFASKYSKENIRYELKILCEKKASTDIVMRMLPGPVRLEFLTSIALVQSFEDLDVLPNYTIDDEGLPTSTAVGGKADIVCHDNKCQSLIEVTLMCGRNEQVNNEIVPIRRHLIEEKKVNENTFSVFVAPKIHEDALEMTEWYKYKDNIDIVAYTVTDFVEKIEKEPEILKLLIPK